MFKNNPIKVWRAIPIALSPTYFFNDMPHFLIWFVKYPQIARWQSIDPNPSVADGEQPLACSLIYLRRG